jgi:tRNA pseudouridine13 synthase
VSVELAEVEGGYRASFDLPRGSYATVVMGELTRSDADLGEAGE